MTIEPANKILKLVPLEVDNSVVEFLEDTLIKAESGQVTGMAYLNLNQDGTYTIGTVGQRTSAFTAAGALHKLANELLASI